MLSSVLAVGFAWLLTPHFEIVGAAIAAAIATVSFKALLAWQAYRQMGIRSWLTFSFHSQAGPPPPSFLRRATTGDTQT
jgi:O-antigen/teichoic acid export membrane protein